MSELLDSTSDLRSTEDPVEDLREFVAFHVRYHISRYEALKIVNLELRSLDAPTRASIVLLRDQYEDILGKILKRGLRRRCFTFKDVRITTFAIIAMLTGIAAWWRPEGRLSVEALVTLHQGLVLGAVGAK